MFGLSMVVPYFSQFTERVFSRLSGQVGSVGQRTGFWGGVVIGLTVGLLWVPCAGPILAAVITLVATQSVTIEAVLITFAYVCGSASVLLMIAYGGKEILSRFRLLNKYSGRIQQFFGVVMILAALALVFNIDRRFQTFIVQRLPSWVLTPLASYESSSEVVGQLQQLRENPGTPQRDIRFDSATLLRDVGPAPEFVKPTKWLNTPEPFTLKALQGNVVLVDFWTYSCINCIRTLPYIEDWHKKYKDKGFTVIGVHSPEFAFEKVQENVEKAIADFGLTYPVVMDNDFGTWRAYENHYWPAHYLIDAQGRIRRYHFGEGDYENMERAIQLLLAERGVQADYELTKEAGVVVDRDISPETYVGYARLDEEQFRSKESVVRDSFSTYSLRYDLSASQYSLGGRWKITPEYAEAEKGSTLRYHFIGKEINLVMSDGVSVPIASGDDSLVCTGEYCQGNGQPKTVLVNGKRVKITVTGTNKKNVSKDVRDNSLLVKAAKLYNLATFAEWTDATIELEFLDDRVQVFAFTFG